MKLFPNFSDPGRILLWDLDGTLVDTSRDLTSAVNAMTAEYGFPKLDLDTVMGHVGRGAQNLVARCLEEHGHTLQNEDDLSRALARFNVHYATDLMKTTETYPGIRELVRQLADGGRKMAVVTNKPEGFSRDILDGLDLSDCFCAVVGGDTLPMRKPDPSPLLLGARQCHPGVDPAKTTMIGDTWVDAAAAGAAGISVILVGWGLGDRKRARSSPHDAWVERVDQLRDLLLG